MANRTVDYEEVQWLNFTIRASDNGSPRRSAEIPVYLQIVDINDNNPVFSQPSYQVSGNPQPRLCLPVRIGTEPVVLQGQLLFPLSVLEPREDCQPTRVLSERLALGPAVTPLGDTPHPR